MQVLVTPWNPQLIFLPSLWMHSVIYNLDIKQYFSNSAIRESMRESGVEEGETPQVLPVQRQEGDGVIAYDEDLQLAMALSEQQLEEDERLRKQEEEELAQVIQLSLAEN